jgi:hypothetical protein
MPTLGDFAAFSTLSLSIQKRRKHALGTSLPFFEVNRAKLTKAGTKLVFQSAEPSFQRLC